MSARLRSRAERRGGWPLRTLSLVSLVALLLPVAALVDVGGLSWAGPMLPGHTDGDVLAHERDGAAGSDDTDEPGVVLPRRPAVTGMLDLEEMRTRPPVAPLTGVELDDDQHATLATRPAATVKIPNNELAHPHTGLEHADLVYEQEIEGGTTRFAAVFHSTHPEVVGNVRSARFVDVDLAAPLDGVLIYAGARGEVLDAVEAAGLISVGAGGPGYFTRPHRAAPHHLYSRLREAVAEREADLPRALPWRFDESPPQGGLEVEGPVRVLMSPTSATTWDYDESAGVFRRSQNDQPHEVTDAGRIGAANVVLLDVPVRERDSHGAPIYDLVGEGRALLLRDGRAYDIGWRKRAVDAHLALVDGVDPARPRPGSTWTLLTYDGTLDDVFDDLR